MAVDALDIEGFESLSPVRPHSGPHSETHLTADAPQLVLTVAEASRKLNIPQSTLYRQVRAGKYQTIKGVDGKPRIVLPGGENHVDYIDGEVAPSNNQTVPTGGHMGTDENHALMFLTQLVQDQTVKLEAATYRNGFLEAQNQVYEQQAKLLPDLQTKAEKAKEQEKRLEELESELSSYKQTWWYRTWRALGGKPRI